MEEQKTLEQRIDALQAIVERLEQGQMGLHEAMELYESGMRLSAEIQTELQTLEGRMMKLTPEGNEVPLREDSLDGE